MNLLFKKTIIKIKKSIGRFLSVLFIVALGVGFFIGLRESASDMLKTLDTYFDSNELMDSKIVSTLGLTNDDVKFLKDLNNVSKVIPSYSVDVLSNGKAIRIHAIENNINKVKLIKGRMPKNSNECLAEIDKYKIGDKIKVERKDLDNYIKVKDYTVVGTVKSVLYISDQKGIVNIGNGKLNSYIFILKDNFILDYYTEIYLIAKNTEKENSYFSGYEKSFNKLLSELIKTKGTRETIRYEEMLEISTNKIIAMENQLNADKAIAETELNGLKTELDKLRSEIDQSKYRLQKSETTYYQNKANNEAQILNTNSEITNLTNQYNSILKNYNVRESNIQGTLKYLESTISSLETTLKYLIKGSYWYNYNLQKLNDAKKEQQDLLSLSTIKIQISDKQTLVSSLQQSLAQQATASLASFESQEKSIQAKETVYNDKNSTYETKVKALDEKVTETNAKITQAKEDLNSIGKPEWYILNRNNNINYSNFKEDTERVDAIAKVFPIFFILVAALISMNTMTRMVEEERTEIGILKSLGYSNLKIISGYLLYVLAATIIGLIIGLFFGYSLIPKIIYGVYASGYILPDLITNVTFSRLLTVVLVSLILMISVTFYTCLNELKYQPAKLLRPKAPKYGKRVLIEKLNAFWKKLSFTSKVTIRNLFRYKKRIIMTVAGVAGCTALLLTGFGLHDGVIGIVNLQYKKIIKYDASYVLNNEQNEITDDLNNLLNKNGSTSNLLIKQEFYTFSANDKVNESYLIVTSDNNKINDFIRLNSITTNKNIEIPKNGVLITEKMSKLLKINKGDNLKIRDSSNKLYILNVSDVVENYLGHYIYISKEYYNKMIKQDCKYNTILTKLNSNDKNFIAENLIQSGKINAVSFLDDIIDSCNKMINNLNNVVYLLIICACLLAIIVLYNLTSINISERTKEIATLKVLGLHNIEILNYIYRETIFLTLIGITFGIMLGVLLHGFVIITTETDSLLLIRDISLESYIYAFTLSTLFSMIILIFTFFKIKDISMTESLKSVE